MKRFALAWLALVVSITTQASSNVIQEIRVEGNSALPQRVIEETVYPFLGPGDEVQVEAARVALEAAYKEAGYPTIGVIASEQVLEELALGFATLQVVEQRIDRVRVTGARYFRNRQIREAMSSLTRGQVLDVRQMQAQLDRLAARSPDLTVRPAIKAGRAPGLLDVELQVRDQMPLHSSLEVNNFASANTEDLRLSATLAYNNLFQKQHGISLSFQTAPESPQDVKVGSATYILRPQRSNAVVAFTGVVTDSEVSAIGGTNVLGEGEFFLTRAIFPLRNGRFRDSLQLGFDFKNTTDVTRFSRTVIEDVTREEVTSNKLDYFNLHAGYNLSHSLWGGVNSYRFALNAGLRGPLNEREEFEIKRFKGEPNYLYGTLNATRIQPLPLGMTMNAELAMQLTADQLIGNEQFGIGGANSVRGYFESEELADYGVRSSLELNLPTWAFAGQPELPLYTYAFWDWGAGAIHEPLPDEDDRFILSSAGIGARIDNWYGFDAEASWAYALRDSINTQAGDTRLVFRVSYGF